MTSKAGLSGLALAEMAAGGVVLWSGISGNPIGYTLKDLIQGTIPKAQIPAGTTSAQSDAAIPVDLSTPANAASNSTTSSSIANDALKYVGHKYVYGGPSNETTGWDCSSFVSYVLGHDLGLPIPGGTWASQTDSGKSHGPTVASYVLWSGAEGVSKTGVQPGDLICFPPDTHIGIATSGSEFVSAEQPSTGTGVAPISSGPGAWIVRRIILGTSDS
jgi:cell wall-associated NlpC family hydrolase